MYPLKGVHRASYSARFRESRRNKGRKSTQIGINKLAAAEITFLIPLNGYSHMLLSKIRTGAFIALKKEERLHQNENMCCSFAHLEKKSTWRLLHQINLQGYSAYFLILFKTKFCIIFSEDFVLKRIIRWSGCTFNAYWSNLYFWRLLGWRWTKSETDHF